MLNENLEQTGVLQKIFEKYRTGLKSTNGQKLLNLQMYLTQKKSILFNPILNAIAGVLMKKNISGKNKQTHTEPANHKKFCQEAKKIT